MDEVVPAILESLQEILDDIEENRADEESAPETLSYNDGCRDTIKQAMEVVQEWL